MTRITKRSEPRTLEAMVSRIRGDVQAYSAQLNTVRMSTTKLAPLVAATFAQYKTDHPDGSKLAFFKMFAPKELQASWPETDAQAKAEGAPTQALFNGMEYLLRKAGQIEKAAQKEVEKAKIIADAETRGRQEAATLGLKDKDAEAHVIKVRDETLAALRSTPITQDEVANVIWNGWYSDLEEYDRFAEFVTSLLSLKYSEATIDSIMEKAQGLIEETQAANDREEAAKFPPAAVIPPPVVHAPQPLMPQPSPAQPGRTLPFFRRAV